MSRAATCPDLGDLQRFVLGQSPEVDAEQLEKHLALCPACVEALATLHGLDTLVDAVRGQAKAVTEPDHATVAELIVRLQELRPHEAGSSADLTNEFQPASGQSSKEKPATGTPSVSEAVDAATLAPSASSPPAPLSTGAGQQYDFLAPPQVADEIGRLGPYRVLKVLGAGGMGVVFQARDPHLDRLVALKTMLPALAANPAARQRFEREAKAAAAIKHDHIVTIHQVGEDRGVPYLAMEFLEGESLDDRLKRENKLPVGDVLRIGREIAEGLAAAHERGLIHRDIKPANIWLETRGEGREARGEKSAGETRAASILASRPSSLAPRVKILDFGLARAAGDKASLTQLGTILGTPAFMAPEQSRNLGVDHRSDLFSLGCVLYRICTGELPFKGTDTMSIVAALALDDPPPPQKLNPEVPPMLSDLVMQLLAKKPDDRPASAGAVALALEDISAKAGDWRIKERRPLASVRRYSDDDDKTGQFVPARSRRSRWRRRIVALAAAAILLLGGIIYVTTDNGRLVIDSKVDDIQVIVSKGGKQYEVMDLKSGTTVKRLPSGDYQIALKGDRTDVKLDKRGFTITRWGKIAVTVTEETGLAAGKSVQLKSFAAADPTITRDGVTPDQGGWRIDAKEPRTVRLFELPTPAVKDCVLTYRAKLKTKDVEGRAFLEMLCQIAFQGEGWSKGLHNAISGTNDWATYEIPFFLCKGQRSDLLKLNLAIEGKGTVWIKDIEVLQSRPKGTTTWPVGPFVILATDGKAEQAYLTLAEAVAAARDGDTIEIHGNGPIPCEPVTVEKKGLIIRAAPGFAPNLSLPAAHKDNKQPLLLVKAPLVLEGVELVRFDASPWRDEQPSYLPLVRVVDTSFHAANCRFTMTRQGGPRGLVAVQVAKSPGATVRLRNCVLLEGDMFLTVDSPRAMVSVENCLVKGIGYAVGSNLYEDLADVRINVHRSTLAGGQSFFFVVFSKDEMLKLKAGACRIEWTENVVLSMPLGVMQAVPKDAVPLRPLELEKQFSHAVKVIGNRNLYSLRDPFSFFYAPPGDKAQVRKLLADWQELWGLKETGSLEGQTKLKNYDAALRKGGMTLDDFRLLPGTPGKAAGKDGKDLGADLDLVGPGAAYDRWKQTPEYREWLKNTGQPASELAEKYTNNLGMEFALVPKGKAWLGGGGGRAGDKEVEILHDFYLGVYEVTQEEWQKVTGLNPSSFQAVPGVAREDQKRFPVEQVSWEDTQAFIKRVNEQAKEGGWVYRLPTAVEWEYACRGGPMKDRFESAFDFYFAKPTNTLLPDQANFEHGKGLKRTRKVGSYQPNRLGLYDMHGNVWEWCDEEIPADPKDPKGASRRVPRGGCWHSVAGNCRVVARYTFPPLNRDGFLGLRLARVPLGKAIVRTASEEITNSIGMKLASIPAGKFTMGSSPEEIKRFKQAAHGWAPPGWDAIEGPRHEVRIEKGFYLGVYEVTQGQYAHVMGINPAKNRETPDHPVEQVAYLDAVEFCAKLSKLPAEKNAGRVYRLPTEAEWEYACRAGKPTAFHWGDSLSSKQANFDGGWPFGGAAKDVYLDKTVKVGSYPANAWGLHDMHGNVWEWCLDGPRKYTAKAVVDPTGPEPIGTSAVLRGGSWHDEGWRCRSALHNLRPPEHRDQFAGFRVVCVR